ncbi:MAG TPA: hypothetical protein PKC30_02485 [Saprospiraceae bacterium]|nr:hypothetical protein [Saprospiraceae bacterium]
MNALQIVKTFSFASIQDMGRPGFRHFGIPTSGFLDPASAINANLQCGNPYDFPLIEFYFTSPIFKVLNPCVIGIGSLGHSVLKNNTLLHEDVLQLENGDQFQVVLEKGVWGYIAVEGGLQCKSAFGSHSYYPGLGLDDHAIVKSQKIAVHSSLKRNAVTHSRINQSYRDSHSIDVIEGPEFDELNKNEKEILLGSTYTILGDSNRMATLCISSNSLHFNREMVSGPVYPGTVQLPSSGKPMILMNDSQVSGGYPRVLIVRKNFLPVLAQKRAGEQFVFNRVSWLQPYL